MWAGAADNLWSQVDFPEYGFTITTPCQSNAISTQRLEGLIITRCEIGGKRYLIIVGEAKKLTFGGRVTNFSYDRALSGAKGSSAQSDGFSEPDEQKIGSLRSFTTKQLKQGGVIYNRTIELDANNILMLGDGCSPTTTSGVCADDEAAHSDALKFFDSFRVLAK